jgi:hypothetical protein
MHETLGRAPRGFARCRAPVAGRRGLLCREAVDSGSGAACGSERSRTLGEGPVENSHARQRYTLDALGVAPLHGVSLRAGAQSWRSTLAQVECSCLHAVRCARTASGGLLSVVPGLPVCPQRGVGCPTGADETGWHRSLVRPAVSELTALHTETTRSRSCLHGGAPRPPAHTAFPPRSLSREPSARRAGCARFELLPPGNAPVRDGHTRERLPGCTARKRPGTHRLPRFTVAALTA